MSGTLLSHAILDSENPVRAMIVVAGNPLLSIAGQERLRKAFEQLDFLIVIDIYPSATSEFAHVVLPSTDMYERDDINIVNIGTSAKPFAQYTPAVVAPAGERKPEWWIAHRLLEAMGKPSIFDGLADGEQPDPWSKWRHMLDRGSGLALADLQRDGVARVLPVPAPGEFYDTQVQTGDGLVDCCPAIFGDAIERSHAFFQDAEARPTGLLLISRRDAWMQNSWFANVAKMKRGGRTTNPLSMHPDDAMADYLLTNVATDLAGRLALGADTVRAKYGPQMDDAAVLALMSVAPEYISAGLDAIRARHGSYDRYLEEVLGIGAGQTAAIRANLLA